MVPETLYVLGFRPSDAVADGRFHRLRVRLVAGKRFSLEARLGYTAPSANAAPVSPPSKMDSEITASYTITDLPAGFTWEQGRGRPVSRWSRTWISPTCTLRPRRAGGRRN